MRARWPHQSWIAEPEPTSTEVPQSQLAVAMAANCQDEERQTQGNVLLNTIELGSREVLYDHCHTTEDIEDIDEFPEEPTETMLPPPPSSWLQRTKTRSTRGETTCRANMPDL